jgi:peptidoglycan/LPS O-acetylase OafA/YrhL
MLTHATRAERDSTPLVPSDRTRLTFLDSLRGLAALTVFVCHGVQVAFSYYYPPFRWFDVGQFGVILFFLCSGFIIPVSLERGGSLGRFWMRRICRLYPLYWLSIALTLLGYATNRLSADDGIAAPDSVASLLLRPAWTVLANLTMLQGFLGAPGLLGVYWTLFYEMLFYGLVSLLFVAGGLQQTAVTTAWFALTACAAYLLQPVLGGLFFPIELLSYPAIMFSGTLIYRAQHGAIALRPAALTIGLTLAMLLLTTHSSDPAGGLHLLTARLAAFAVFLAGLRPAWTPGWLSRAVGALGGWSYSLYLMHSFVLVVVPALGGPLVTIGLWTGATLLISALTYRWIERPGIALGQYLTRRPPQP